MTIAFIEEYFVPIIIALCLCIGYIMKHWLPNDNKIIPTVLGILGGIAGVIMFGVNIQGIVKGIASGLAATGLHQAFKEFIEGRFAKLTMESAADIISSEKAYQDAMADKNVEVMDEVEVPEGIGGAFSPMLKAPSITDKNWIHRSKGGYNDCILVSGKSVLPNCVGYAWGAWRKRLGKTPKLCKGNARNWATYDDGYKRSQYPRLGSIAVWDDGIYGHVAEAETYDLKTGEVAFGNSAWGGKRFYVTKIKPPYHFGSYKLKCFIHLPDSEPLPAYTDGKKKYTTYKVVCKDGMNIRSEAGTKGKKLGTIAYNKTFKSSKKSGDWAYYDDKDGWVCIKEGETTYLKKA